MGMVLTLLPNHEGVKVDLDTKIGKGIPNHKHFEQILYSKGQQSRGRAGKGYTMNRCSLHPACCPKDFQDMNKWGQRYAMPTQDYITDITLLYI
jgi:hypothetical protein